MKAPQPEVVVSSRSNPGETLRKARESKSLAQADVAQQLNLTLRALIELEAGAFDKLPGHTFARGYIRAYAKLLGLEQNRLVADFDAYTGTDSAGSSVQALGRIEEPTHLAQSLLRFVSVALLLGLLAASFFWWQEQSSSQGIDTAISRALEHVDARFVLAGPWDQPETEARARAPASESEPPLTEQVATTTPGAEAAPGNASQPAPVLEPATAAVAPLVAAVPAAPINTPVANAQPLPEAPAPAPVQARAAPSSSPPTTRRSSASCSWRAPTAATTARPWMSRLIPAVKQPA